MKKFYSGLAMLAVLPTLMSCGEDGQDPIGGLGGDLTKQCGLECKSVVDASGSVSGIADVDAFFESALKFKGQANVLDAEVRAVLREMAVALKLDVAAGASTADLAAAIEGHIKSGFNGQIDADAGLSIKFTPPRCEVSAQATLQAKAKCEAEVDPGMVSVECKGGCVIDAQAKADCSGKVQCSGKAPSFKCEGACEGSCKLEAAAECSGTCTGTCNLDVAGTCDGECLGTLEGGKCTGECKLSGGAKCEGKCEGSCEVQGGAECKGECTGTCKYDPGGASCEGELTCEAEASAMVECKGECKGEIEPPQVKAECEASVKAEANFSAECQPPALDVDYRLSAAFQTEVEGNAALKAEFEAQLAGFVKAFGKLQAKAAKLDLVAKAGADLVGAASGAVKGGINSAVNGSGSIQVKVGAACALKALPEASKMVGDASSSVGASLAACGKIGASVKS